MSIQLSIAIGINLLCRNCIYKNVFYHKSIIHIYKMKEC